MNRSVFVSSTYEDLKEHRKAVWDLLGCYDVRVRGMERFGARTNDALSTCLTECEQSDVYVGIVRPAGPRSSPEYADRRGNRRTSFWPPQLEFHTQVSPSYSLQAVDRHLRFVLHGAQNISISSLYS